MPSITRLEALRIARDECSRRGWTWNEQTSVRWGLFSYAVWGGGRKGGNLCVKIRRKDGIVLRSSLTPR